MSKKADVWMPIYIGDYLADTAMLSTEQHGAYLLMLMAYWKNGPLPDDDEILANITRLPIDRWKKTRGLLLGFFSVIDGFLINRRSDEEKEKADAFLAKQRSNGAKGGRPPKPKNPNETQNKPMGSVWLNPNHNPNETPSPSPIDTTTATSAGDGGADLDGQQVDKLPPITRGAGEPKILITTEWGPSDHFDTMATMRRGGNALLNLFRIGYRVAKSKRRPTGITGCCKRAYAGKTQTRQRLFRQRPGIQRNRHCTISTESIIPTE